MDNITVVAVDDHPLIRLGIKAQVDQEPNMTFVSEGQCGKDVFRLVEEYKPDVLFLDIHMPQDSSCNGRFQIVPAAMILREQYPQTAIIVVTIEISQTILEDVLLAGVQSYLLKSDGLTLMLPDAIRSVHNGGIYLSKSVKDQVDRNGDDSVLTKRQKQIVVVMAEYADLSVAEQANILNMTEGALRNQRSNIYKRLGVTNDASCLIESIKRNIITIDNEN